MSADTTTDDKMSVDPITFEVLRHRLEEIVDEAYYTLARLSGNAVITEAGDHEECILNANGDTIMAGGGIVEWTQALECGGRFIAAEYAENPGFFEGDQFVINATEVAAVHHMDIQVLKPIFWDGKLIAWMNTAGHTMEVGGIQPGGVATKATERVQEGLKMYGIKLCDRGVIRHDIEMTLKNMTREPEMLVLELRARMAANTAAEKRLHETIEEFGIETVMNVFDELPKYSERRIRQRLASLPDGEFTAVHYFESFAEGEDYLAVKCKLIKHGTELTMDFTGSSPQSRGPQNVALPGAKSNAACPFMMMLAYDIPWNYGLWNVINWVMPLGTVMNPTDDAPVSVNTPAGAGYISIGTVTDCISQLFLASDQQEEAFGNGSNTFNNPMLWGKGRRGDFFITMLMENLICGAGALVHRDGDDTCSNMWTTKPVVTNVERAEEMFPWIYLWRKESVDTGGPGRNRGGTGTTVAFMPWGTEHLDVHANGMGDQVRLANGLAGGYPAPNVRQHIVRESNIYGLFEAGKLPRTPEEIEGNATVHGCNTDFEFDRGDVYIYHCGGGGGFGDPIERDPAKVAFDVYNHYVSNDEAARTYGVVLGGDGQPDEAATKARRDEIRAERLSLATVPETDDVPEIGADAKVVGEWGKAIEIVEGPDGKSYWRVLASGHVLGSTDQDWKAYAATYRSPQWRGQTEAIAKTTEDFQLREYYCPSTGALLEVITQHADDPELQSFKLKGIGEQALEGVDAELRSAGAVTA